MVIKWFKFLLLSAVIAGSFYIAFLDYNAEQNVLELQKRDPLVNIVLLIVWCALCWLVIKRFKRKGELIEQLYQQQYQQGLELNVQEVSEEPLVTPEEIVPEEPSPYKLINLRNMKLMSGGNVDYEKRATTQFMERIPQELAALREKYDRGDIFGINSVAHQLKITIATMGLMPQLEDELDQLEYVKSDALEIPALIDTVAAICSDALMEAQEFYQTLETA